MTQVPRPRPSNKSRYEIAVFTSSVEPGIDVGLLGGGQCSTLFVEPSQEVERDCDLASDVGRGAGGDDPTGCSSAGAPQDMPHREGAHQRGVMCWTPTEGVFEPRFDAGEQFVACGEYCSVDEQVP